jgi:hypothetical protein
MKLADFAERVMGEPIPPWQRKVIDAVEAASRCRWCGGIVIRHLPCRCDRAQNEARRIMADRR